MIADLLTLLREDWLFGALGILAVLASVALLAAVCCAGRGVRSVVKAKPGSLFPDGEEEHLPAPWTPLDRGVPHRPGSFRSEHRATAVAEESKGCAS